ncbi:MAG: hypothetical protein MUF06_16940 [Pirellulaceae bacterium]|nr:hypothetical protein [Pirellulaceae bacterium]
MVDRYLEMVREEAPDAVLISGDIGEATDVVGYLEQFDDVLQLPMYFVWGITITPNGASPSSAAHRHSSSQHTHCRTSRS